MTSNRSYHEVVLLAAGYVVAEQTQVVGVEGLGFGVEYCVFEEEEEFF